MIRYPYENVVGPRQDAPLSCRKSRLFLDYEAFEVDGRGRLAFTRTFGRERHSPASPPRFGFKFLATFEQLFPLQ